jgi:membrane protease YdiL (CAAX protease family)
MAAVVAYHTRSLVPSMVMHALHNGGLLAMLLMTTR